MKKSERKFSERLAAIVLSAVITVSYTPIYVFADNEANVPAQNTVADSGSTIGSDTNKIRYTVTPAAISDDIRNLYAVTVNNSEGEIEVHPNDEITVRVEPRYQFEGSYKIVSLKIGNESIGSAIGKDRFEYKFKFSEEQADANGDLKISAELSQVYTVSFTYNSNNGSIEPDKEFSAFDAENPSHTVGTVFLENGESLGFKAEPAEHYRVESVKIDYSSYKFNQNDFIYESKLPADNKNHNVEVTFSLNKYTVTVSDPKNGTVSVSSNTVDYGGSVEATFRANHGYYLNDASVDGKSISANEVSNNKYTITDITSDKVISASFEKFTAATVEDFSWNSEDALAQNNNEYIFSEGTEAVFKTHKGGIRLRNTDNAVIGGGESQKSVSVNGRDTVEIAAVELFYSESFFVPSSWHTIRLNEPISLSFYQGARVSLSLPELEAPYTCYNSDVVIGLDIEIPEYSDVEAIEYWIGDSTDHISFDDLDERQIVVPASIYNEKDIVVHVNVTDKQGHVTNVSSDSFSINAVKPTVGISIDGVSDVNASKGNFNTFKEDGSVRTATVTISDRSYTFNKDSVFQIEKDGKALDKDAIAGMVSFDEKGDILTAKIVFSEDGNYKWSVNYTNSAGSHNEGYSSANDKTDFEFKIDSTPATGLITISKNPFETLLDTLTFGVYSMDKFDVSISANDLLSSTDIWYYISNDPAPLNRSALDKLTDEEWTAYSGAFELSNDNLYVVYAKIRDDSGNITYICSDGHIIDSGKPQVKISPESYLRIDNDTTYVYNESAKDGIDISLSATDSEVSSGIKSVTYWVEADGNKTQEETIYSFDKSAPAYSDLLKNWAGTIRVDPVKNNSSNAAVYVKVTDNAGCTVTNSVYLDINITAPEIDLSYDNNKDNNGNGYFNKQRTATIVITDRENHFSQENADDGIIISSVDVNGKKIENIEPEHIWKHEGNIHTLTLLFEENANYTMSINYTNGVGNKASQVNTGNSVSPYAFTVDMDLPAGTIKTVRDPWNSLLKVLTFGIFTSEKFNVSATASDVTSPTKIGYYISNETVPLTSSQLDAVRWTDYKDSFTLKDPNNYVIYIKVTDSAGNYTYISSNGHIIDNKAPNATITFEPANSNNVYNKDVIATINVTDEAPYSGIRSIEYWVESRLSAASAAKETQREIFTVYDNESSAYSDLINDWTGSVIIDSSLNNSSYVTMYVKVVDNAGLEFTTSKTIDIDITPPSIEVSYDNNTDYNGNTYFNASRTATITVTERSNHFSANDAANGIIITAVDVNGNSVDLPVISNWNTVIGATPDQDTHTATISYDSDANYTFEISYTDKADNANSDVNTGESTAPYKFTVDKTAPVGSVTAASAEGRINTWDALVNNLSFGFWSNTRISISGTSEDLTSPIFPVQYFKFSSTNAVDAAVALNAAELDAVTAWMDFDSFDIYPNEQSTIYLKITDYAGNTTYISTNGLILDDNAPRDEITAPRINITPEQTESGIYNSDVTVSIAVSDPLVGGTYSGLKTIRYYVYNMGQETKQENLYYFSSESPLQNELQQSWNGEIKVDSRQNNSNDVIVEVYAEDNAGNTSTERISLKIDVTPPSIVVSYNNNTARNDLFKDGRTATITIYERNFSDKYVVLKTERNGSSYIDSAAWSSSGGTGNGDNTTWTAAIPFNEDGDYTFAIKCTDLASNPSGQTNFADGTVLGEKFTIDGTAPRISVIFEDEDSSPQGSYYKAARTATIAIDEHHFNREIAKNGIVITGSNDGTVVEVKPSDWQNGQNADIYTATAVFKQDSDYKINVSYTDEAGNAAAPVEYSFTVDKIDPALSVRVNDKKGFGAYNNSVLPVISYNDVNFDPKQVDISMTGINVTVSAPTITGDEVIFTLEGKSGKKVEWKAHFEENEAHYGKILTFDDYPEGSDMGEFDDIYALTVSVTDKSGRTSKQVSNFSVNRYGSTYDIKSVENILGSYVHNVTGVAVKEINPNELKNYSITLFKNNETIILKEGRDFNVQKIGNELDWHEYLYDINDEIFTDDGTYSLTFHSEDKAGNISENTLETKNSDISFGVDNTPPLVVVANVENGKTYNVETLNAIMTANDNLVLSSVEVKLDGKSLKSWDSDQIAKINRIEDPDERLFDFDISGDSTDAHTLEVICYDAAGNTNESLVIKNFYVTTDNWTIFKNWIRNHIPLAAVSLTGAAAIIGCGIFLIVKKRRKSS